jgi:hypothetical protein
MQKEFSIQLRERLRLLSKNIESSLDAQLDKLLNRQNLIILSNLSNTLKNAKRI